MTCIVGLEHDGRVWIGGDSAGVAGWSLTVRADEKVFANGDFIFGFTTSFRMGQLLRYGLTLPSLCRDGDIPSLWSDPDRWMATQFVDAVRDCLKAGGYSKKSDEVESGGQFLVGYKGHLWQVDRDYQVGRAAHGYLAVGCGDELALGAMHAVSDGLSPHDTVLAALRAAEAHSAGVRGPFKVLST